MTEARLRETLEGRAPGQWELYRKSAESRELSRVLSPSPGRSSSEKQSAEAWRREDGWAARWWEKDLQRFVCASTAEALEREIAGSPLLTTRTETPPPLPRGHRAGESGISAAPPIDPPPDLFDELQRLLAAESRGEALLSRLVARRGRTAERIENGGGLDVWLASSVFDGHAVAVGRKSGHACEARALFRWDADPDIASLARRLSDRATLPLSGRSTPVARGEWLLDPSVGAALLASLAPLLCLGRPLPPWVHRENLFAAPVTVVDDACGDAPFDGEGTPTRRVTVVEAGALRERLSDLRASAAAGSPPTGHGVRTSYRTPPAAAPRRLFFETAGGEAPAQLLSSVRRGLFASALTAPLELDFEGDRYEMEFTGVAIIGGRAQGPVAGARSRGRLSQLLRRIRAVSTDRQFFPRPFPTGAPTLLIERAEFE